MPAKDRLHLAFGESLKSWRQQRAMSQEELAEEIGVSTSFIGMLERGEKTTTLKRIGKIADSLSIEVKDLFATNEEVSSLYRECEILVRNILSAANESELKLFAGFCELFSTYISGHK